MQKAFKNGEEPFKLYLDIMASDNGLSVDKFTIKEHRFKTNDASHTLYVQEWGNLNGAPVLFLHGGPGSGCNDGHKNYFDAEKHRVVFIDQRGSGKSRPYGSLENNTTEHLLDDIKLTRDRLEIEKWAAVHGRSWGSTLSLCYAIKYPDHIDKLIIGGIFLATKPEVEWLEKAEFRTFYPEVEEQKKITPYTYAKLVIPTVKIDDRYSMPDPEDFEEEKFKIELHYTKNGCFLPPDHILDNAPKLSMPVDIVQGRYDMMTPPVAAYKLHQKLQNSRLHWTIAGHAGSDRANYDVTKALLSQVG